MFLTFLAFSAFNFGEKLRINNAFEYEQLLHKKVVFETEENAEKKEFGKKQEQFGNKDEENANNLKETTKTNEKLKEKTVLDAKNKIISEKEQKTVKSEDKTNIDDKLNTNYKFGQKSEKENQNKMIIICHGPNTRKNKFGICQCMKGFEYGDPSSRMGCYHCTRKCHANAHCVYPGKCACADGRVGDGVNECKIPLPIIASYEPNVAKAEGGETLTVKYFLETNYTQSYGYCKFGHKTVKGNITEPGVLKCVIPPANTKGEKVLMSFDSENWSTTGFALMYKRRIETNVVILLLLAVAVFISLMAFYFLKVRNANKLNSEIDIKAEKTPFHNHSFRAHEGDFDNEL